MDDLLVLLAERGDKIKELRRKLGLPKDSDEEEDGEDGQIDLT